MIDILIVNYNCVTYLQTLLDTLIHEKCAVISRRCEYEITVIDNHSSDGSASMVETQYPDIRLIPRASNDGYAAAVNEGLAATRNREILLLNSDVRITPQAVSALARIWERLEYPGIVAPLHFEEDGFPQLTWGNKPTLATEKRRQKLDAAARRRESWVKRELLAEGCRTRQVDWVSGSCMFFPRSTVEEVGPWDQNFFLFFEDIDWCLQARGKGLLIYHTSEVHVKHTHGASMDEDPDLAEMEYRRSQCYFTKKYYGGMNLFQLRLYLTAKQLKRWIQGRWSGFDRGTSYQILREVWRKPGM